MPFTVEIEEWVTDDFDTGSDGGRCEGKRDDSFDACFVFAIGGEFTIGHPQVPVQAVVEGEGEWDGLVGGGVVPLDHGEILTTE